MPVMDTQTPIYPVPPAAPRRTRTGLIVGSILVGLLVIGGAAVGVGLAVHHGSTGPSDTQQAITACEANVKIQLKAPATAQFSGAQTSPAGDGYSVSGNVDAQNGFGALIRSRWTCGARKAADGGWTGIATIEDDN